MRLRFRMQLLLAAVLLCAAGCQPFHPLDTPGILRYAAMNAVRARFPVPGVEMEIAVHDSLDQNLEVFDCDLSRAGIHPVWVRLRNDGPQTILLEESHINVTGSSGHAALLVEPALVVELLYKSYKTRLYSPHFRRQLENRFEEMQLKKANLQPGQEVFGYLFLRFEDKRHHDMRGARFVWSGIRKTKDDSTVVLEHVFPAGF